MITLFRRHTLLQQQIAQWRQRRQAQWTIPAIRGLDPAIPYVPNPESVEATYTTYPRLILRDRLRREILL